jgi:2,5-diketo-D-gluconate reductase A
MSDATPGGAPVPRLTLNTGAEIPQVGVGVFQVPPEETAANVAAALSAGYRSIDTATRYDNEPGVGEAIRDSGLDRDDLFVATKLANADQGYEEGLAAFDASLEALGLETIDLYLIHWPAPRRGRMLDSWRALEEVHASGRAKAIGVSNFLPHHIDQLAAASAVVPAVNQIELHPYFQQRELRALHAERGIVTEAWGPLGQGTVLADPVIVSIAERLGRTTAQVILRWHLQLGTVVIPKSMNPLRLRENLDVLGFELSDDDLAEIASLDGTGEGDGRIGFHPDRFSGLPDDPK